MKFWRIDSTLTMDLYCDFCTARVSQTWMNYLFTGKGNILEKAKANGWRLNRKEKIATCPQCLLRQKRMTDESTTI